MDKQLEEYNRRQKRFVVRMFGSAIVFGSGWPLFGALVTKYPDLSPYIVLPLVAFLVVGSLAALFWIIAVPYD